MATIFHLALASDWAAAQTAGAYTISTRGRTLAEEGFIHASRGDQWPAIRERFYADVTEPLVLLQIETGRLGVPLIEEPALPGGTETFPHIYGPLKVDAVVRAIPLDGASPEPVTATPAPVAPSHDDRPRPQGTFAQTYFREMFINAGLIMIVVALGFAGIVVGALLDDSSPLPAFTGLLGVAGGIVVATAIHRRRT